MFGQNPCHDPCFEGVETSFCTQHRSPTPRPHRTTAHTARTPGAHRSAAIGRLHPEAQVLRVAPIVEEHQHASDGLQPRLEGTLQVVRASFEDEDDRGQRVPVLFGRVPVTMGDTDPLPPNLKSSLLAPTSKVSFLTVPGKVPLDP